MNTTPHWLLRFLRCFKQIPHHFRIKSILKKRPSAAVGSTDDELEAVAPAAEAALPSVPPMMPTVVQEQSGKDWNLDPHCKLFPIHYYSVMFVYHAVGQTHILICSIIEYTGC